MEVILVHGFCGLPQDWNSVSASLLEQKPDLRIHIPNLWIDAPPSQFSTLEAAAEKMASLYSGKNLTLVGYSLGGRIVSHWPQSQWSRVKKMILISAHGGLANSDEKLARQEMDLRWSERFLNQPWDKVIADWSKQPVFAGDSMRTIRQEADFNRKELALSLKFWSLSSQKDAAFEQLSEAPFPVEYVVGQKDTKFLNYAEEVLKPKRPHWVFRSLSAGHSLHFSHGLELAKMILAELT